MGSAGRGGAGGERGAGAPAAASGSLRARPVCLPVSPRPSPHRAASWEAGGFSSVCVYLGTRGGWGCSPWGDGSGGGPRGHRLPRQALPCPAPPLPSARVGAEQPPRPTQTQKGFPKRSSLKTSQRRIHLLDFRPFRESPSEQRWDLSAPRKLSADLPSLLSYLA